MGKRGPHRVEVEEITLEYLLARTRQAIHVPDLGPCRIWAGSFDGNGYPTYKVRSLLKRDTYVHRMGYGLTTFGSIHLPDTVGDVRRACRCRGCIEPTHLVDYKRKTKPRRKDA